MEAGDPDALAWFADDDPEPFSFCWCAEQLGFAMETVQITGDGVMLFGLLEDFGIAVADGADLN